MFEARAGNKIADVHENPVDIVLLRISERLLPVLHATGHSPNHITTYSFALGLTSVYCLYHHRVSLFAVLFFVSYFFDCVDGQYARRYRQVTAFGDAYDHGTDVVVALLLGVVLVVRYAHITRPLHIALIGCLVYLNAMSFGCQQCVYNGGNAELLDGLHAVCPSRGAIHWTRFFGGGTTVLLLVLLVLLLQRRIDTGPSHVAR
jgi:phosphatidylglycerophosphate synthase